MPRDIIDAEISQEAQTTNKDEPETGKLFNRFSGVTREKISSILATLPQKVAPHKAEELRSEFTEFIAYLNDRDSALRIIYSRSGSTEIQQPTRVKTDESLLQERLRTPFVITFARYYLFSRDHNLPHMLFSRESILKEYPNFIEAFDKVVALTDDQFLVERGEELTTRIRQIWEESHNVAQRAHAGHRNVEFSSGTIIEPGDLLHGGSSETLDDVLDNGLWCPELRSARWVPMGANHLSIACGEAIQSINLRQLQRYVKKINPVIFSTLYPRGEAIVNNDSFFVQYSGNMASLYGLMEPDLVK